MLFFTINDFVTYDNLSGYGVKGNNVCLVSEENTNYIPLKHGQKMV